jgi:tRNA 2-thiocytidine biosynthesis protein TtcA
MPRPLVRSPLIKYNTDCERVEPVPERPLAKRLLKKVNKAIREYDLIGDSDRIVVAVSGGGDSLSLLQLLQMRQRSVPEKVDLLAVHVYDDADTDERLRVDLEAWFQASGVEYAFEPLEVPADESRPLTCFRCAWHRRKALFLAADRLHCNKVAFGHHADDAAETALLNLFYSGRLESMEPRVEFFDGKITVIRPLIYVPKEELTRFAQASGFPSPPPRCPNSLTSRRARMQAILQELESDHQGARSNLLHALRRAKKTEQ